MYDMLWKPNNPKPIILLKVVGGLLINYVCDVNLCLISMIVILIFVIIIEIEMKLDDI